MAKKIKSKKKFELSLIPLEDNDYKKPERPTPHIEDSEYERLDKAYQVSANLSQDGNIYVKSDKLSDYLHCDNDDAAYIYDNKISDDSKKNISGSDVVNASELVGLLDKRSHELIDSKIASINKYARDTLINMGDSDKAESIRRQRDDFVEANEKKLKKERGTTKDEITGEDLKKGAAFHHNNKKSIYTDPSDRIDPKKGINVNDDTHDEIHKEKIHDEKELNNKLTIVKSKLEKRKLEE